MNADDSPSGHARHFRVRPIDFLIVVALGLAQAALLVVFALLMREIVLAMEPIGVGAAERTRYQRALALCLWLAALGAGLGLLRFGEFYASERAGYEVVRRLRMMMYRHLQGMTPDQLRHRARGGLLLRMTGDLSMLRMWLSRGQLTGTSSAIVVVGAIGIVAWFDVWLGVAMVAGLALTALVSVVNGRAMRAATRVMRRRRSLVIGNIDEQINTLAVQQVAGRTRGELNRLSAQNDNLTRALIRVALLRGRLRGLALAGSLLVTALVLLIGLVQVRSGLADIGEVVSALLVSRLIAGRVRTIGLAHDYWHRGLVSQQKVAEFLDSTSRGWDLPQLERLRVGKGEIVFDNVTSHLVENLTATVPAGRLVGITGLMGSGKSTLLRLVARLDDPAQGMVSIDGQDLRSVSPLTVSRNVGFASADLPLLRGSFQRNVTYRNRDVSTMEVQRVVFGVGLDKVLTRHVHGINGWLTEGGTNLSLGERQLVALARAMVGNPPILLLDEPFTFLDRESRADVMDQILRYRGTVLLVSQNSEELAQMDEVWTMRDGRLVDVCSGREFATRERLGLTA